MTNLFLEVLNASFAASWLVLAVIAARLLLKKAPRWMVCGLWALVAVRLIFGGIEAPFSLLPSDQIIPPESLFAQAPAIHSGISSIDSAINPVYSEALRANPTASVNPLQVWLAVFANFWVLGVVVMAVWAAVSWLRVRRQVRESILAEDGVFLCDRISSPFIFGLFRPRIYLPDDLDGNSRGHVIAHEQAHLARRDHWWKPLGFALLTINWFNPLLWLAYALLCRDIEMACDEKVVRDLSVEEKKSYSAALLGCSINPRRITACPLAFGEVGVKQRVKSVLNYKKPAFWVVLAAVVLIVILAAALLTNPLSTDAEIRWDNVLYIQDGRAVKELPADAQNVGTLDSPLDTIIHPNGNGQAANLSTEYAGQPLYLSGTTLYIEKPDGKSWLPFIPRHSLEDVLDLLDRTVQIDLRLEGSEVSISENIRNFISKEDALQIRDALICDAAGMHPSLEWDQTTMLAVNYADNITIIIAEKDYECQCTLVRRDSDWLMLYRDEDWAVSAWTFESPMLDATLIPWQQELDFSSELFASFAADAPIYLDFRTMSLKDTALRMGIPNSSFGMDSTDTYWEWQGNSSFDDNTITSRCRPYGRNDWMEIRFCDQPEPLSDAAFLQEAITLANGASGTLYHCGNPSRWEMIVLNTTRGLLYTRMDASGSSSSWTDEDYQLALAILGTLSVTQDGTSLLGDPNRLGITLRAEEATIQSLKLFYYHSGEQADWERIVTTPQWTLERLEDGAWVNIMPEATAWPDVAMEVPINGTTALNINLAYVFGDLESGHYRISKTFHAHPVSSTGQAAEQTCYAEFDLNALGITLSLENITPNGATLVCTQDGTLWDRIITGTSWNVERYADGQWVSVLPETTAWTTMAYVIDPGTTRSWNLNWSLIAGSLEPGRYRVSKTFTGERTPMFTLGIEKTELQQTCYAEFTIE